MTGKIPPELRKLTNLEGLHIDKNQLSGEIPLELGDLPSLERLYVADNRLTGCVPHGLRLLRENDFDALGLPFCPPSPADADRGARWWPSTTPPAAPPGLAPPTG